jgi:hypothetical protein
LFFALALAVYPDRPSSTTTGIIDPCLSTAASAGGHAVFCPAGDGTLASSGATVTVTLRDQTGSAIAGVPAHDVWLTLCGADACPCSGGADRVYADAATSVTGVTTISLGLAVGGYPAGGRVLAQGTELGDPADCSTPYCPVSIRSPDLNCDARVDLIDLAFLAGVVTSGVLDDRCDYNGDGSVNAMDVALFAPHYLHGCEE